MVGSRGGGRNLTPILQIGPESQVPSDAAMDTRAHVLDQKGRRCAEARATFVVLSPATARDAIGDITSESSRLLRDATS